MRKFVDNEEEFEDEDSGLMVEEFREIWPELVEIDATDFVILKEQLVRKAIVLEYRLIRPFVAEACF
jgi:hypothetical protein